MSTTNLLVFTNSASALLASGIADTDTEVTLQAGYGALFPALTSGQYFVATLEDTSGDLEVVWATAVASDTISITRGQEGTTALAFASGSRFELRCTAGVMGTMLQKNGGDTLSGTTTNNGVIQQNDTGSIQGGEIAGAYIRGSSGETDNEFFVPDGGGAPTIGTSTVLTAANLVSSLPSGTGLMQTGMICLWYGTSNGIPDGYVVCDGSNSTPDLRDNFVLGAGGSLPTSGGSSTTTTSATDPSGSQTIAGTALTIDQIPSHTHEFWSSGIGFYNGSDASYPGVMVAAGGGYTTNLTTTSQPFLQAVGGDGTDGNANTHTHTLSGGLSHTHTYSLPPYVALFYIMKT